MYAGLRKDLLVLEVGVDLLRLRFLNMLSCHKRSGCLIQTERGGVRRPLQTNGLQHVPGYGNAYEHA